MNFKEELDHILTEGWEELGISDPGIKWQKPTRYTDEEISKSAVASYGLGNYKNKPKWDMVRRHPKFIAMVRDMIFGVMRQIEDIKNKSKNQPMKQRLGAIVSDLGEISDSAVEIAQEIGYGDPRDIIMSAQRHPFLDELYQKRNAVKDAYR